jgi:hypothetical protein
VTAVAARDVDATELQRPATIRERCANVLAAADAGLSRHFRVERGHLDAAASRVAAVTRLRYPSLDIPCHSRWRHFEAGGVDRRGELDRALAGHSAAARARARIDLAVVSVLLDAGAGAAWTYVEPRSGLRFARSEGLAVASFRAFMAGAFSTHSDDPLRVDAQALLRIDTAALARLFHADAGNPLTGLEGRASLLQRLGAVLADRSDLFGAAARPGMLFDALANDRASLSAVELLTALLDGLGPIWLTGSRLGGIALGDVWRHPHAGGRGPTAGWVPFHKLSQWLAYSLFEPFEWAGVAVTDRELLTALPEYRNGGLLLDTGALALVHPATATVALDVGSELVVEWRALTVALMDELVPRVRLRLDAPDLPLACILEGGTWAAGRALAQELRDGAPPLTIRSDGTVF